MDSDDQKAPSKRQTIDLLGVLGCFALIAVVVLAAWLSYRQHSDAERAFQARLVLHERAHELGDLDEHPVVAARREEAKELRCHGQIVLRVLVGELADDVDGARHHRGLLVVELVLVRCRGTARCCFGRARLFVAERNIS
mgnify:CR=1 FL=1